VSRLRQHSVIPGFGLTLGYTLSYLSLIVLIPLSALAVKGAAQPWAQFSGAVFDSRTLAAWRLTFGTAFIASLINAFFGLIVAWTLVRYNDSITSN
jgi:sulfate/thiosulfate transport system permease protein